MKTQLLATTIATLAIAKETGLLLSFNFDKLHIEGASQAISISQETGAVSKAELVTINKTIDFESIDIEKLKTAVLSSVDTDLFQLKTDDRELLVCHQFKTVCTSVAFKGLNTKCVNAGFISESERLELTKLNNADKFMSYLLPLIMCEDVVKRSNNAAAAPEFDFKEYGLDAAMFVTDKPKYCYAMPSNGDYKGHVKVYLKAEYVAQFFPLAAQGIFNMKYGIAQLTEGDFAGAFAVLLSPKQ